MKKSIFIYKALFITLFIANTSAICSEDGMEDLHIDLPISTTSLHEWMPQPEYNPIENEYIVLWHSTGVRNEGGENMYSLHGQRVARDGKMLGESFMPIESIGPERRLTPKAVFNPFNSKYMVAFIMGRESTGWDPFVTILDSNGTSFSEPVALSDNPATQNHVTIVFNSVRRQYLVAYNDSRNGNADIFGVIVDEDGAIVKEEFSITSIEGDQINPQSCYNHTDDTYLINWEDFRHVSHWQDPSNIYGALLNGDGSFIVNDIPMIEDHGTDNEGDQRHNTTAYNPDKNQFLVAWMDARPSLNNVGIVGRLFNSDGSPAGNDFTIADPPGPQIFPDISYIHERKMYFAVWDDGQNDNPEAYWRDTENWDTYAKWISSSGESLGAEFPIILREGTQRYGKVAYNALMDRFLIVWRDFVDEEVFEEGGSGHITESGGNIMGKIYGTPSFLTARVVEDGTDSPVSDASVFVFGLALPAVKTTNTHGWLHIEKGGQLNGKYFILVYKTGYSLTFKSVTYSGEPLEITIKLVPAG